jgi:hypothetical protein
VTSGDTRARRGAGRDLVLSNWNLPEMTGIEPSRSRAALGLTVRPFTAEAFADALATVVTA